MDFDNSKDASRGPDETPVRARKALLLILELLLLSNVVQLIVMRMERFGNCAKNDAWSIAIA